MPNLSTLTAIAGGIPAGAVMSFAMSAAPIGWVPCDGTTVTRTGSGANLFAAIGTIYGVGNGTTTFNVPDYRGEFLRGWDNSRGVDTGRVFGSSQVDTFKTHNHTIRAGSVPEGGGVARIRDLVHAGNNGYSTNAGSDGGGSETRPRNLAVFYCIKL